MKIRNKQLTYSLPLLFVASILPDLDFALYPYFAHHTITHSITFWLPVYAPILLIFRSRAIPYLIGTFSHFLIGDMITGNPPLFYGISDQTFGTVRPWIDQTFGQQVGLFYQAVIDIMMIFGFLSIVLLRRKRMAFPALLGNPRYHQQDMLNLLILSSVVFVILVGAYTNDIVYTLSRGSNDAPWQSLNIQYTAYGMVIVSNTVFILALFRGTLRKIKEEMASLP